MFESEKLLSGVFQKLLTEVDSPFSAMQTACEFDYREGRTDIICNMRNNRLVAFELKLEKWKTALNQAYRNTSFAHYSYVVLPADKLGSALSEKEEFRRRGVGLCSVDMTGIQVQIRATGTKPFQPWLTKRAKLFVKDQ